jgi:hypothetical protein
MEIVSDGVVLIARRQKEWVKKVKRITQDNSEQFIVGLRTDAGESGGRYITEAKPELAAKKCL